MKSTLVICFGLISLAQPFLAHAAKIESADFTQSLQEGRYAVSRTRLQFLSKKQKRELIDIEQATWMARRLSKSVTDLRWNFDDLGLRAQLRSRQNRLNRPQTDKNLEGDLFHTSNDLFLAVQDFTILQARVAELLLITPRSGVLFPSVRALDQAASNLYQDALWLNITCVEITQDFIQAKLSLEVSKIKLYAGNIADGAKMVQEQAIKLTQLFKKENKKFRNISRLGGRW